MTFWRDFDAQLEEVSGCVNHTSKAQLSPNPPMV